MRGKKCVEEDFNKGRKELFFLQKLVKFLFYARRRNLFLCYFIVYNIDNNNKAYFNCKFNVFKECYNLKKKQ